jgi:membrane associated rhomboid family serine protease
MVAIDGMLWWLSGIDQYLGLSGVLHALAAAAVVRQIVDRQDPLAWGIGVCGLAKIAWENLVDAMPFMGSAAVVVTDAHLAGVIAGMLAGLCLRR